MNVLEAKDFLVQETARQAAIEGVTLSDLEKRMMYFTETGECPEDPIELNDAFEAEHDTTAYEKKISLLMSHSYRRIKRESPENLRLWNDAFRVLRRGDHYLLLFWQQNAIRKTPRLWPIYLLGALAVVSFYLLRFFLFDNRGGFGRGGQVPADKYLPNLSPVVQHTLQLLLLLLFLFASFPQVLSRLAEFIKRLFQSASTAQREK